MFFFQASHRKQAIYYEYTLIIKKQRAQYNNPQTTDLGSFFDVAIEKKLIY